MTVQTRQVQDVVIRFAGDSGDGIQLMGSEFTRATAYAINDLGTFPDFPAEIRAPVGTMAGVSGYQIRFGSNKLFTPGDLCDALVVMNSAALRKNLSNLKPGGIILANEDGFDARNLRLAGFPDDAKPLEEAEAKGYTVYRIPLTKLTREAVKDLKLGTKEADRSKNMFALGMVFWMYHRPIESTEAYLKRKFGGNDLILEANMRALHAGYNYGETAELFANRFQVEPAKLKPGLYRNITGNVATALGLIAAAKKAGTELFYGTYPITPASDILHELARHKNYGVITFQAEDEIAAVVSAIGASYGGKLGVTASSGPGIDLKAEAIGLAIMLELPLVIIDVQRAGPSTGMPTKTEQADLLLAYFGRHGEAPMPIIAAKSPTDCFDAIYEACRVAIEHMTPVFFLSDAYLANGSEPWSFPKGDELKPIEPKWAEARREDDAKYMPYERDEDLVRQWAVPGLTGLQNRIGGIEKESPSGNISYDPLNHQRMVDLRAERVEKIAEHLPPLELDNGLETSELLILSWGSTYGIVKTAVQELREEGFDVSHAHLRWLNPFPKNLGTILGSFKRILIPEMNTGQLRMLIRSRYLVPAEGLNKVQGLPFYTREIKEKVKQMLEGAAVS